MYGTLYITYQRSITALFLPYKLLIKMGRGIQYNIYKDKNYFMTMTAVDLIDWFTRVTQKQLIVDSLKYCQENKGLNIFGWCLMPGQFTFIRKSKKHI